MSESTVRKEIQKLQRAIVLGLENIKASEIVVYDTAHLSPLFERVFIATGSSNRQTRAIASSVRESVRAAGFPKPRLEGEENGEWIIVDCGAAVAHVMQPAIRQYYRLEEIWGDKPLRLKLGAPKPPAPLKEAGPEGGAPNAKSNTKSNAGSKARSAPKAAPKSTQKADRATAEAGAKKTAPRPPSTKSTTKLAAKSSAGSPSKSPPKTSGAARASAAAANARVPAKSTAISLAKSPSMAAPRAPKSASKSAPKSASATAGKAQKAPSPVQPVKAVQANRASPLAAGAIKRQATGELSARSAAAKKSAGLAPKDAKEAKEGKKGAK